MLSISRSFGTTRDSPIPRMVSPHVSTLTGYYDGDLEEMVEEKCTSNILNTAMRFRTNLGGYTKTGRCGKQGVPHDSQLFYVCKIPACQPNWSTENGQKCIPDVNDVGDRILTWITLNATSLAYRKYGAAHATEKEIRSCPADETDTEDCDAETPSTCCSCPRCLSWNLRQSDKYYVFALRKKQAYLEVKGANQESPVVEVNKECLLNFLNYWFSRKNGEASRKTHTLDIENLAMNFLRVLCCDGSTPRDKRIKPVCHQVLCGPSGKSWMLEYGRYRDGKFQECIFQEKPVNEADGINTAGTNEDDQLETDAMLLEEYNRICGMRVFYQNQLRTKQLKALAVLQRVWRGCLGRRRAKRLKSTRQNAVLVMQRVWRGYQVRRQNPEPGTRDFAGPSENGVQSQPEREIIDLTLDEEPQSGVASCKVKRKRAGTPKRSAGKKRRATTSRRRWNSKEAVAAMEHHIGRHYIIRLSGTHVWMQGTVVHADPGFVFFRLQNDPEDANLRQEPIAVFTSRMSTTQHSDFLWVDEEDMEDYAERDYFRCLCGTGQMRHRCARVWVCDTCSRAVGETTPVGE